MQDANYQPCLVASYTESVTRFINDDTARRLLAICDNYAQPATFFVTQHRKVEDVTPVWIESAKAEALCKELDWQLSTGWGKGDIAIVYRYALNSKGHLLQLIELLNEGDLRATDSVIAAQLEYQKLLASKA